MNTASKGVMRMSAAAYDRLILTGKVQFDSISFFTMRQAQGEHASACLRGVPTDDTSKFLAGKVAGETVTILDKDADWRLPIFEGAIDTVHFSTENGLDVVELRLLAGSTSLDIVKKSKSYQDASLTYDEIIKDVLRDFPDGMSLVSGEISGKRIGSPVIRYRETAWEFIRRLASHYNLSVFSDARSSEPRVYVGVPNIHSEAIFTTNTYKASGGKEYYAAGGAAAGFRKQDFLRYTVNDGTPYYLGWQAEFKGRRLNICGKSCQMDGGLLSYEYILADRKFCSVGRKHNPYFRGMSLLGSVLLSEKDDVRIHLDIDEGQDVDKAWPWPWTPETGNLMYLMPRKGTRVSLYFGDDDEANGQALNCIRVNDPAPPMAKPAVAAEENNPPSGMDDDYGFLNDVFNPDYRSLTTEYNKNIYLNPGSLGFRTIQTAPLPADMTLAVPQILHEIDIRDRTGIRLKSKKSFVIMAGGNIRIRAKNLRITGKEYTYIARAVIRMEMPSETAMRYQRGRGSAAMAWEPEIVIEPKAELHFRKSAEAGKGDMEIAVTNALFAGWTSLSYPLYNDAPMEESFNPWELAGKMLVGLAIVAGLAALTFFTGGFG
ncbi:MAG: phage late control D family protein, partial [Peptococcaceae bacterium]|nr:phage late control D family protein [Peptococcaceae bacterium]